VGRFELAANIVKRLMQERDNPEIAKIFMTDADGNTSVDVEALRRHIKGVDQMQAAMRTYATERAGTVAAELEEMRKDAYTIEEIEALHQKALDLRAELIAQLQEKAGKHERRDVMEVEGDIQLIFQQNVFNKFVSMVGEAELVAYIGVDEIGAPARSVVVPAKEITETLIAYLEDQGDGSVAAHDFARLFGITVNDVRGLHKLESFFGEQIVALPQHSEMVQIVSQISELGYMQLASMLVTRYAGQVVRSDGGVDVQALLDILTDRELAVANVKHEFDALYSETKAAITAASDAPLSLGSLEKIQTLMDESKLTLVSKANDFLSGLGDDELNQDIEAYINSLHGELKGVRDQALVDKPVVVEINGQPVSFILNDDTVGRFTQYVEEYLAEHAVIKSEVLYAEEEFRVLEAVYVTSSLSVSRTSSVDYSDLISIWYPVPRPEYDPQHHMTGFGAAVLFTRLVAKYGEFVVSQDTDGNAVLDMDKFIDELTRTDQDRAERRLETILKNELPRLRDYVKSLREEGALPVATFNAINEQFLAVKARIQGLATDARSKAQAVWSAFVQAYQDDLLTNPLSATVDGTRYTFDPAALDAIMMQLHREGKLDKALMEKFDAMIKQGETTWQYSDFSYLNYARIYLQESFLGGGLRFVGEADEEKSLSEMKYAFTLGELVRLPGINGKDLSKLDVVEKDSLKVTPMDPLKLLGLFDMRAVAPGSGVSAGGMMKASSMMVSSSSAGLVADVSLRIDDNSSQLPWKSARFKAFELIPAMLAEFGDKVTINGKVNEELFQLMLEGRYDTEREALYQAAKARVAAYDLQIKELKEKIAERNNAQALKAGAVEAYLKGVDNLPTGHNIGLILEPQILLSGGPSPTDILHELEAERAALVDLLSDHLAPEEWALVRAHLEVTPDTAGAIQSTINAKASAEHWAKIYNDKVAEISEYIGRYNETLRAAKDRLDLYAEQIADLEAAMTAVRKAVEDKDAAKQAYQAAFAKLPAGHDLQEIYEALLAQLDDPASDAVKVLALIKAEKAAIGTLLDEGLTAENLEKMDARLLVKIDVAPALRTSKERKAWYDGLTLRYQEGQQIVEAYIALYDKLTQSAQDRIALYAGQIKALEEAIAEQEKAGDAKSVAIQAYLAAFEKLPKGHNIYHVLEPAILLSGPEPTAVLAELKAEKAALEEIEKDGTTAAELKAIDAHLEVTPDAEGAISGAVHAKERADVWTAIYANKTEEIIAYISLHNALVTGLKEKIADYEAKQALLNEKITARDNAKDAMAAEQAAYLAARETLPGDHPLGAPVLYPLPETLNPDEDANLMLKRVEAELKGLNDLLKYGLTADEFTAAEAAINKETSIMKAIDFSGKVKEMAEQNVILYENQIRQIEAYNDRHAEVLKLLITMEMQYGIKMKDAPVISWNADLDPVSAQFELSGTALPFQVVLVLDPVTGAVAIEGRPVTDLNDDGVISGADAALSTLLLKDIPLAADEDALVLKYIESPEGELYARILIDGEPFLAAYNRDADGTPSYAFALNADFDMDGALEVSDIVAVRNAAKMIDSMQVPLRLHQPDMNGDGKVDSRDLNLAAKGYDDALLIVSGGKLLMSALEPVMWIILDRDGDGAVTDADKKIVYNEIKSVIYAMEQARALARELAKQMSFVPLIKNVASSADEPEAQAPTIASTPISRNLYFFFQAARDEVSRQASGSNAEGEQVLRFTPSFVKGFLELLAQSETGLFTQPQATDLTAEDGELNVYLNQPETVMDILFS